MTSPAPRPWGNKIPDHPVDLDALQTIIQLGKAGTITGAELRMRLRQVIQ